MEWARAGRGQFFWSVFTHQCDERTVPTTQLVCNTGGLGGSRDREVPMVCWGGGQRSDIYQALGPMEMPGPPPWPCASSAAPGTDENSLAGKAWPNLGDARPLSSRHRRQEGPATTRTWLAALSICLPRNQGVSSPFVVTDLHQCSRGGYLELPLDTTRGNLFGSGILIRPHIPKEDGRGHTTSRAGSTIPYSARLQHSEEAVVVAANQRPWTDEQTSTQERTGTPAS